MTMNHRNIPVAETLRRLTPTSRRNGGRAWLGRLATLCVLVGALSLQGQAQVSPSQLKEIVDGASRLLLANYVFPEVARAMDSHLQQRHAAGAYAETTEPASLARALTEDLQAVSRDRHLVIWSPSRRRSNPTPPPAERPRSLTHRILDGNVGYIKIPRFSPVDTIGTDLEAAMAAVSESEALVIDLRQNGGGSPSSVMLLAGYLIPERTLVARIYSRPEDRYTEMWTTPVQRHHFAGDVFILTDKGTFSAAEAAAYHLKHLGRARIVGEPTGGGAHRVWRQDLPHGLRISIPITRPINVNTGSDWEGAGVQPDVPVPAAEALEAALREARAPGRDGSGVADQEVELEVFAPGVVSVDGLSVYRGDFSPDGSAFYFFRRTAPRGENYRIYVTRLVEGKWMPARALDLGGDHSDLYPTLSPDGRFMVFSSYRPVPETTTVAQANLWLVERGDEGWGAPQYLEGLSNPEAYNPGPVWGSDDILRYKEVTWGPSGRRLHLAASWTGASFDDPQTDRDFRWAGRIEGHYVWDATLSPDGSIAVLGVSSIDERGRRGPSDLWVSHYRNERWTAPAPIPGVNDPDVNENFMLFSPDGSSLLFVRDFKVYYSLPIGALSR